MIYHFEIFLERSFTTLVQFSWNDALVNIVMLFVRMMLVSQLPDISILEVILFQT